MSCTPPPQGCQKPFSARNAAGTKTVMASFPRPPTTRGTESGANLNGSFDFAEVASRSGTPAGPSGVQVLLPLFRVCACAATPAAQVGRGGPALFDSQTRGRDAPRTGRLEARPTRKCDIAFSVARRDTLEI